MITTSLSARTTWLLVLGLACLYPVVCSPYVPWWVLVLTALYGSGVSGNRDVEPRYITTLDAPLGFTTEEEQEAFRDGWLACGDDVRSRRKQ